MVNTYRRSVLIFLWIVLPFFLLSGEFTASVNQKQVQLGDSFVLDLILKDTSAKKIPSTDRLQKEFTIHSQRQMSNTSIINGKITSSITWRLTLMASKEGEMVIPPINIDTAEGILTSNPIIIQVVKTTGSSSSDALESVVITADVTNSQPYKNEPFVMTVKILSRKGMADIQVEKIDLENGVIEVSEEPKMYKTLVDGFHVNVIEFSYLITPLKAGLLTIPPIAVKGVVSENHLSGARSLFDEDPFGILQRFAQYKPFQISTEEKAITVQPQAAAMRSWLPAKSLTIEESWDNPQSLQVGEPFTREFKMTAEGVKAHQIPSLSDQQLYNDSFKTYADQPDLGDETRNHEIFSYRKEQYTLIPQKPGTLILPELSIEWWDVNKKEKVIARVPARTVTILPSTESTLTTEVKGVENLIVDHPIVIETQQVVTHRDPMLYALIAGLAVLLLIAVFWGISLQKKITRYEEPSLLKEKMIKPPVKPSNLPVKKTAKKKPSKKDPNEKLPDLNPT